MEIWRQKNSNEEAGLDWYNVSARNYEASLGRWMNIDPASDVLED